MPPGPAPQVGKPANNVDVKAVSNHKRKAVPETNADEKNEIYNDTSGNTLTPALKMVRDMQIEPMYERKARNLMAKIFDNPDILKRNFQGELVVNGIAEPLTNFNSLFTSMVGHVHDLEQNGIDKFLGALHQIGVKSNDLSGQALQRPYSQKPPLVRASARVPRPKPHQPDFVYSRNNKDKKQSSAQQLGQGLKRQVVQSPGQRPKILYVY